MRLKKMLRMTGWSAEGKVREEKMRLHAGRRWFVKDSIVFGATCKRLGKWG
jgi:hypothetical protein